MERSAASLDWRARQAARSGDDAAARWRFARSVARVHAVDAIVAEYATSYCGLPARRREIAPMQSAVQLPGVTWSIDKEVVVEFLYYGDGPGRLIVYEIALVKPLKRGVRSRHVRLEHAGSSVRV
jgi:hypothetical protein